MSIFCVIFTVAFFQIKNGNDIGTK